MSNVFKFGGNILRIKLLVILVCISVSCYLASCSSVSDITTTQGNSNSMEAITTSPIEILSPTGGGKMLLQDNNYKAEHDFDTLFQEYDRITTFFSSPHNMNDCDLHQSYDIDFDGKNENIVLTNLGYNGGDGGYSLGIYKDDGTELYYAEDYNVFVQFTDDGAEIHCGDTIIETLSMDQLNALYYEKGELEYFKEVYKSGYIAYGDAISGAIYDEENNECVIKSYLQGVIGHADCLGYVLVSVGRTEDGSFGIMSYSYCIDK